MFTKLSYKAKTKTTKNRKLEGNGEVIGPRESYAWTVSNALFSKHCSEESSHHSQPPKSVLGLWHPAVSKFGVI